MNYISYSVAKELATSLVRCYNDRSDTTQILEDEYRSPDCRDYVKRIYTINCDFTNNRKISEFSIEEIHSRFRKKILSLYDVSNMSIQDGVFYIFAEPYEFSILITPSSPDEPYEDYNVNDDSKVAQILSINSTVRPILLAYPSIESDAEIVTARAYRCNEINADASTGTIRANRFVGDFEGNLVGPSTSCNGNAVTSNMAKRLGDVSVGSKYNPIFLDNGRATPCNISREDVIAHYGLRTVVDLNLSVGDNEILHDLDMMYPQVTVYNANGDIVPVNVSCVSSGKIRINTQTRIPNAHVVISM
jgi:hypothetical protein